ncbi:MAG: hypothetical protein AAF719_11375 [Pseudomonadota bacterium]
MLNTLKLLLPAIIPSWRFFDAVAPSPRIEFAWCDASGEAIGDWEEFRPRPARLSSATLIRRLAWNPRWNETLFLVSCSERLIANPTDHSRDEIFRRLEAELAPMHAAGAPRQNWFQFRLVFLSRQGDTVRRDVLYTSPTRRLEAGASS